MLRIILLVWFVLCRPVLLRASAHCTLPHSTSSFHSPSSSSETPFHPLVFWFSFILHLRRLICRPLRTTLSLHVSLLLLSSFSLRFLSSPVFPLFIGVISLFPLPSCLSPSHLFLHRSLFRASLSLSLPSHCCRHFPRLIRSPSPLYTDVLLQPVLS